VQSEYSLCTRNPEIAVLDACRELGTTFVAFSPLARGFLTSSPPDAEAFDAKDIRRAMPRFSPANHKANLGLLTEYEALAREAGCSPAQLALGWVLRHGSHVVAIPGTTSTGHLEENLGGAVTLPPGMAARLDALINPRTLAGRRYNEATQAEIDTEEFP
jgi:aryl-alcohol dehydrogenase-like predicted oxidoreductase